MTFMRIYHLFLASLLLACLMPLSAAGAEKPKKSVLYINSYHQGYRWSDSIRDGIRSVLDESKYKIDLQIEYMDAKKYNYDDVTRMLLRLYKEKFAHDKFDVVIVSDNDAYMFASQYRDILFPGVPMVFCGVNDLNERKVRRHDTTGMGEQFDLIDTLNAALKLHPDKKRLVVVGDTSTAGTAIRQQIKDGMKHFAGRLEAQYWTDMSLLDVLNRVDGLPEDTMLFFVPYYQIINGRFLTAEEVVKAIYDRTNVPIYTDWEFLVGHGAVGGRVLSGYHHGRLAADMVLKILDGESPASIPIINNPTGTYIFDYLALERLGLTEDDLPPGSTIINAPKAFYELPKELFWTIIVSFALLVLVMIFLLLAMRERRKVESKIKDQLAFQQTLMDTVPQLVSWKDSNGRYLGTNRAFADFFGLRDGEAVVRKTSREIMRDPDYVTWAMDADQAVIHQHQAVRKVRRKLANAQGEPSWIEVNKVPIEDRSGKVVGVLSTAENITKERNLERQLLQSQKMEAIGTLAGGIAHDFNNILTSIINSTELAVGDVNRGSVTYKDLKRVLKAARRGGRVVKQILAFSRPSTEGFRSTDIGAVIVEVLGLLESSLPRNIEVRSAIASPLPPVVADPTQIHQVAMNLCTNAFHALRQTGGIIEVRVDTAELHADGAELMGLEQGEYVRLVIEDNGPGIPPDILDKIFDPFFSTKDKAEGTGLGLAVVHGIVRSHSGGLQVSPRPGGGVSFSIFLPKGDESQQQFDLSSNDLPTPGTRILFVEDDQDQLDTTPRLLENMGCKVTPVGDPFRAAAMVEDKHQNFDLIITDYDMPGMSGTQLAERVMKTTLSLPIIMVSGREDTALKAVGLPTIKRVIIKPYEKDDLADAIMDVLRTKRKED